MSYCLILIFQLFNRPYFIVMEGSDAEGEVNMTFSDHQCVMKQKESRDPGSLFVSRYNCTGKCWAHIYRMMFRGPFLEHFKQRKTCSTILALPWCKNL